MMKKLDVMKQCQAKLQNQPTDLTLASEELKAVDDDMQVHKAYMSFLRQNSKAYWLKDGDQNSSYFHRCIQQRNVVNKIYTIADKDGVSRGTPEEIETAFLDVYNDLLGKKVTDRSHVNSHVVKKGKVVSNEDKNWLCLPFTKDDVKNAM